jgi:hypothetical protein
MGKLSIRYIVHDVDAAIPFYELLGFQLVLHPAPGFAGLSKDGALRLTRCMAQILGGSAR